MYPDTAGEHFPRQGEARRYITQNHQRLRPLAESRCPADNRLLTAVYRLRDGFWLWRVGERANRFSAQSSRTRRWSLRRWSSMVTAPLNSARF